MSRVLNGKPGVAEGTRQAVLTALDVLGYERPTRLRRKSAGLVAWIVPEPGRTRSSRPSPRPSRPPWPCTASRPCGDPDPRRRARGRLHADAARTQRQRDHLRLRPACRLPRRPRQRYRPAEAGLPIVLVNGYVEDVEAPCVSSDEVASMGLALAHLVGVGASGPGRGRAGEVRAGHPQDRRLPQGDAGAARSSDVEDLIERSLFSVEGGPAAAGRLWTGLHRDRQRVGPDGARCDPWGSPGRWGCASRRTSRSWGTTTHR